MIDPNKQYQTRDGRPVRIYAVDGVEPDAAIHGAVYEANMRKCGWTIACWYADGVSAAYKDDDLIPLPDWRDEIPWEAIRPEYRWVAKDRSTRWYAYEDRPQEDNETQEWDIELDRFSSLEAIVMPAGPDDWREAIAERPEGR